jgi:hypothetical protein
VKRGSTFADAMATWGTCCWQALQALATFFVHDRERDRGVLTSVHALLSRSSSHSDMSSATVQYTVKRSYTLAHCPRVHKANRMGAVGSGSTGGPGS